MGNLKKKEGFRIGLLAGLVNLCRSVHTDSNVFIAFIILKDSKIHHIGVGLFFSQSDISLDLTLLI